MSEAIREWNDMTRISGQTNSLSSTAPARQISKAICFLTTALTLLLILHGKPGFVRLSRELSCYGENMTHRLTFQSLRLIGATCLTPASTFLKRGISRWTPPLTRSQCSSVSSSKERNDHESMA